MNDIREIVTKAIVGRGRKIIKQSDNISIGTSTICGTHSEHIEQIALSSLMSDSTVFSISKISCIS